MPDFRLIDFRKTGALDRKDLQQTVVTVGRMIFRTVRTVHHGDGDVSAVA